MTEKEEFAISIDELLQVIKHGGGAIHVKTALNALEAIEKMTPKKLIIERGRFTDFYCPCCGELIEDFGYEKFYCDQCGQRLDWSDGDD